MNDEDFVRFTDVLQEYLEMEKVFVQDPKRIAEVEEAMKIAKYIFPEAKVTIEDDPIQMGSLILRIENFDILVRNPEDFNKLISKASNFEIYSIDSETLRLSIMFDHALIRLKK